MVFVSCWCAALQQLGSGERCSSQNAMTNLVVQFMQGTSWSYHSGCQRGSCLTGVIMWTTLPDSVSGCKLTSVQGDDVDTARWLKVRGIQVSPMGGGFINLHKQFMAESKSWPGNSTFALLVADLGG